jgi:hypothetical protein
MCNNVAYINIFSDDIRHKANNGATASWKQYIVPEYFII